MSPTLILMLSIVALAPTDRVRPTINLEVSVAGPVIPQGRPVVFRVSIENKGEPCRWVAIDPFMAGGKCGDRPFTLVSVEIADANGRPVALKGPPLGLAPALEPGDLLTLTCGAFFGSTVTVGGEGGLDWQGVLAPGQYTARFIITLNVASYFEERLQLLSAEAKRRHRSVEALRTMLPNQTLRSVPISFTVAAR
jgi:hypothetical protein